MPKSLAQIAAELFPTIVNKLPDYFIGVDFNSDAICLRDGYGSTQVLFTRAELDDNLHPLVMDTRLAQIADSGRFDRDIEIDMLQSILASRIA